MKSRFTIEQSCLLVIDVQGRLADLMYQKKRLFKEIITMIEAAKILGIPVHWFEQYPKGLGETKAAIKKLLSDDFYHEKLSFSACGVTDFMNQLRASGRHQCIVTGIETHVCVYQTVLDLLANGLSVKVNQQAVSSRQRSNKKLGLRNMEQAGAEITSTEMILFELMRTAKNPQFRNISRLLK
ncbi:MAG: isochorismatase family protein [Marinicella sp.]|nr:isochorismatase family protein [Xanthomonadales bacterium]